MPVPVMQIRIMRVLVAHRRVLVPVRMRLRYGTVMGMSVVLVMDVTVFVRQRLVDMLVLVPFS
jgi:hypothetical protein